MSVAASHYNTPADAAVPGTPHPPTARATSSRLTDRHSTGRDSTSRDLAGRRRLVLADLVVSTDRSRARDATLVVAGAAWIAGLGQLAIPLGFTPVPMTMGTFAVLTAGAALGVQRAAAATLLFLVSGLAGAPVFAGGQSGAGLPTLGYAIGYIGAATLVGWAAERGLDRSPGRAFGVMAVGSAVVYLVGVPYLTVAAGLTLDGGIVQGLVPFLVGDLIKAVAGAAALTGAWLATGGRAAARRS